MVKMLIPSTKLMTAKINRTVERSSIIPELKSTYRVRSENSQKATHNKMRTFAFIREFPFVKAI